MKNRSLIVILIFVIAVSNLVSEEVIKRDTLKVYPLPEVVVTASRVKYHKWEVPISIDIKKINEIEFKNSMPLYEELNSSFPGLFVTSRSNIGYGVSRGSAGMISIRGISGFPTTRSLILIDGRPDIMGIFGHPIHDVYFLTNAKSIEVIKGPASLLYGSNALAGAINVALKHEYPEGIHLSIPITYGSFNTINYALSHTFEKNGLGYSVSMGTRRSEGYRTFEGTGKDSYESNFLNLEAHYNRAKNAKIYSNVYISDIYLYDPRQVTAPSDTDWYDLKRGGFDITGEYDFGKLTSEIKMHYNYGDHKIFDGWKSKDYNYGLMLTESYNFNHSNHLILGYDYRNYGGDVFLGSWNSYSISEHSMIGIIHGRLLEKLVLEGGVRFVYGDVEKGLVLPSAGAIYSVNRYLNIKAYYSKGYRNPTISELYLFRPANKGLKPEYSENLEFSADFWWKSISGTVSFFNIDVDNMIQTVNFKNVNIASFSSKGAEFSLKYHLNMGALNIGLYKAKYSNNVVGSPELKIICGFDYKVSKKISGMINAQYISGLYSYKNPYAYGPPSYVKLDPILLISAGVNFKPFRSVILNLKVNNLLDKKYEMMYGYPLPGINFTFGLKYSI